MHAITRVIQRKVLIGIGICKMFTFFFAVFFAFISIRAVSSSCKDATV